MKIVQALDCLDRHFIFSLLKSGIRFAAGLAMFFAGTPFMMVAGMFFILAEVFGVIEEF
jgi:hypothetical protein